MRNLCTGSIIKTHDYESQRLYIIESYIEECIYWLKWIILINNQHLIKMWILSQISMSSVNGCDKFKHNCIR